MSLAFVWAVIWGMGLLLGFERSLRLITFALGALVLAVLLGIGYLSARRESKVR